MQIAQNGAWFTTNTVLVIFKQTNKQLHSAALPGSVIFTLSAYLAVHTPPLHSRCTQVIVRYTRQGVSCSLLQQGLCHTCTAALRKAGVCLLTTTSSQRAFTHAARVSAAPCSARKEKHRDGKLATRLLAHWSDGCVFIMSCTHSVNKVYSVPTVCQSLSYIGPCPLGIFSSGK